MTHKELIEAELREQIAQEIEDLICLTLHPTVQTQLGCKAERYSYERAAKIARGKR